MHIVMPQEIWFLELFLLCAILLSVRPTPKGFFHTYKLRKVIYVVTMKHHALLFPGRIKIKQNPLNLEDMPPTRRAGGFRSVVLLWTLLFILLKRKQQLCRQNWKEHTAMVRREYEVKLKCTGDYFRRWCSLGEQLETRSATQYWCICRLHLTVFRQLWSPNGQRGSSLPARS